MVYLLIAWWIYTMAMLVITTSYHLMVAGAQHLRILRQAFGTRSQAIRIQKRQTPLVIMKHLVLLIISVVQPTRNQDPLDLWKQIGLDSWLLPGCWIKPACPGGAGPSRGRFSRELVGVVSGFRWLLGSFHHLGDWVMKQHLFRCLHSILSNICITLVASFWHSKGCKGVDLALREAAMDIFSLGCVWSLRCLRSLFSSWMFKTKPEWYHWYLSSFLYQTPIKKHRWTRNVDKIQMIRHPRTSNRFVWSRLLGQSPQFLGLKTTWDFPGKTVRKKVTAQQRQGGNFFL